MKEFFTRKKTTWVILALIALLPLPTVIQYMQRFVVRNGVVTAYRYEVLAPIDGVVGDITVSPGTVSGDKPALRLGNKRKMFQYKTLESELVELEASLARSQARLAEYTEKVTNDISQSLNILEARLIGELAARRESENRRSRTARLVETAVATQEDADRVESQYQTDAAKVRSTRLEIEQLKHRRRMLGQGIFPSDLSDGLIQVQNRINTLEQYILDTKRRMSEAETDEAAVAGESNSRASSASIMLPETAVVWEVNVQDGMEVAKGEPLLTYIDRSRLMVVVAVDDATLEVIRPGHPVKVRLFGRSKFIEGTVSRVMGSAGIWRSTLFAAALADRAARDGRVFVRIDDEELHDEVEKFCGVGRTAYAEFEGVGLIEQYFGAFLR